MVFISPKNIVVDFLRTKLTDPRSRAESTNNETFNGGGTTFSLTPTSGSLSCVTAITVTSVSQLKWKDYRIDFQNQQVIFYSNTASGTLNVSITYKQGTSNWIYPDKAKTSLSATSFPRLNVLLVSGNAERLGQYNSNMQSVMRFQIDIWSKENQAFTIDSVKYSGDKLSEYLGHQVMVEFNENEDELHPELYNYVALSVPRDLGFDAELECFHHIVEAEFKGIDVSEGQ